MQGARRSAISRQGSLLRNASAGPSSLATLLSGASSFSLLYVPCIRSVVHGALSQGSLLRNASAGPSSLATLLSGAESCTQACVCWAMAVLCAESSEPGLPPAQCLSRPQQPGHAALRCKLLLSPLCAMHP